MTVSDMSLTQGFQSMRCPHWETWKRWQLDIGNHRQFYWRSCPVGGCLPRHGDGEAPQTVSGSTGHRRFRQRLLVDGVPLQNDMLLPALANVQLVILNFVASDQTSAKELDRACKTNLIDQMLQKPMSDPNVRGPSGCFFRTHSHRSGWPRLEVVQLGVVAWKCFDR